jgi:MFS family permease
VNDNDRAIVELVTLGHATVHTYELSIPILMTVWLDIFTVDEATLGLVVGVGYALFGLGALPGGMLADVFGSRRLILACLAGMGGSFALLSVAPSVAVLVVALICWGLAASVYHPSGLALISKGVERRGRAFALHGMAGNLGIAIGPLVTALLLLFVGWKVATAILVLPALLGVLLAARIDIDESAAVEEPVADGGDSKTDAVTSLPEFLSGTRTLFAGHFVLVFGVVVMSGLYYRGVLTFMPELLGRFPALDTVAMFGTEWEPGRFVYAGLLTIGMAGQYAGGILTDRIRPSLGIAAAFGILVALALVFLPAARAGVVPLLVVGALLGLFLFVVQPLYQATVAELTPPGTRGLSYGYTYLGVFGIGAAGGAIAGAVLAFATADALFLLLAGVAGVASVLGLALARTE